MTEVRSKRRVLPLIFIVKSFTKSLLIRFLKNTICKCATHINTVYFLFICIIQECDYDGINI